MSFNLIFMGTPEFCREFLEYIHSNVEFNIKAVYTQAPKKCEVDYLDYDGKKKTLSADGLLATCIQHEIDHLEGILFIDYLSKLKKTIIVKKLSKQKKSPDRIIV